MRTRTIRLALAIVLVCPTANAQWVLTNGPQYFEVNALAVSGRSVFASGCIDAYAPHYGVFRSTDNGMSWMASDKGLPDTRFEAIAVAPDVGSGTTLFAGSIWGRGIFATTNNGASWTAVNEGLPYDSTSHTYGPVMCLFTTASSVFAGINGDVFRSTNRGATWTQALVTGSLVRAFAVREGSLLAGAGCSPCDSSGTYRSTNDGRSWTKLSDFGFSRFAFCGPYLFAQSIGGLKIPASTHRSTDNGATWSSTNSPTWYGVFAVEGTSLFYGNTGCGGCDVVLVSNDYATTWAKVDSGFPYLWSLTALTSNGIYLFAGTYSGVWRRPLSEMITFVPQLSSELPATCELGQNYPNPFNPSTTIKYELPQSSLVKLSVYDLLGREVSLLVNERKEAGYHQVKFDGSGLSSGVYVYRLQAGDFTQAQLLLLLK